MKQWQVPTTKQPDPATVSGPSESSLSYTSMQFEETAFAQGGTADIYKATAPIGGTKRIVAVKKPRILGTLTKNQIQAVMSEAKTWQRIDDHAHVVGIMDWGIKPDPWIAMEYMDGGNLQRRLTAEGQLPVAEALWISRCLARAVRHGHRHRIVHRDLKPANVLFRQTQSDTWPLPKIADWGLAKDLLEHTQTTKGYSTNYAAPEQIDPDNPTSTDDYTDIYQLGVIVYELLTGKLPYDATGPAYSMRVIDPAASPIPPSERRSELTREVDATVLTALEHDKEDRYETVVNFRQALDALQGEGRLPHSVQDVLEQNESGSNERLRSPQDSAATRERKNQSTSVGGQKTWPMFQGGPQHTSHRPQTSGPQTNVAPEWTYETNGCVKSSPAVADGTVYVGSYDNNVYALDEDSGGVVWTYETGAGVESSPAVVDGTVYVGSNDNSVYALDASNGEVIWTYETDKEVYSSPVVADGTVYVGSYDNSVYALDAHNGEVIWSYGTDSFVRSSPAVVDNTVYVGSCDSTVYALNADSGEVDWTHEASAQVERSPAVTDGTVYAGSSDNSVYALDADNGEVIWTHETGRRVESSPAVANGTIYVGSWDNSVYALDADNGEVIWTCETGGWMDSSPAVADGIVYVGSCDNSVYALDADNGEVIWTYETDKEVYSSPAVADDGTVYVGSRDGSLYALREQ